MRSQEILEKPLEIEDVILDTDPRKLEVLIKEVTYRLCLSFKNLPTLEKKEKRLQQLLLSSSGDSQKPLWFTFSSSWPLLKGLSTELRNKIIFLAATSEQLTEIIYGDTNLIGLTGEKIDLVETKLSTSLLPIYTLEGTTSSSLAVGTEVINPVTFVTVQRFFNFFSEKIARYPQLNDQEQEIFWNIILLGKIYGYFESDNQQSKTFRHLLTPLITDRLPLVIQEIKLAQSDSERLKLLKQTWPKVFTSYWVALSRQDSVGISHPLNKATKTIAEKKLPFHMATLFTPDRSDQSASGDSTEHPEQASSLERASSLDLAVFQAQNLQLQRHLVNLTRHYSDAPNIEYQHIKKIFSHALSHQIFMIISNHLLTVPPEKIQINTFLTIIQDIEAVFPQVSGQSSLEQVFGSTWKTISPIEKVCLLSFIAFISNGQIMNNTKQMVGILQNTLLPALAHHSDFVIDFDQISKLPINYSWSGYKTAKTAAKARLSSYDITTNYIEQSTSAEVLAQFNKREQLLDEFSQLTKIALSRKHILRIKKFFEHINKPGNERKGGVNIAFWLIMGLTTGVLTYKTINEPEFEGIFVALAALAIPATIIGSAYIKANLDFGKEVEKSELPLSELSTILGEISESVTKEFKSSIKKKLLAYIVTSVLLALLLSFLMGSPPNYTEESGNASNQPLEQFESSENSESWLDGIKDYIQNIKGEWKDTFSNEEDSQKDEPKFYVYGTQRTDLFWPLQIRAPFLAYQDQADREILGLQSATILPLDTQVRALESKETRRFTQIMYTQSLNEFKENVDEYTRSPDFLVRINLTKERMDYESPAGYEPQTIIIYDAKNQNYQARIRALGVITISPDEDTSNNANEALIGIVYKKVAEEFPPLTESTQELLNLEDGPVVTAEEWSASNINILRPIIQWAIQEGDDKTLDTSDQDILEAIARFVKEKGVVVGQPTFEEMMNQKGTRLENLLLIEDGKFKYKWRPSDIQFVVVKVAQSAGIKIHTIDGYSDSSKTPYGGSDNSRTTKLVYYDRLSESWQYFDSLSLFSNLNPVYPDEQDLETDILADLIEAERKRQQFMLSLLIGGLLATAGVGAKILHSRKIDDRIQEFEKKTKEKRQEFQDQISLQSPQVQLGVWSVFISILGVIDIDLKDAEGTRKVTGWHSFHHGALDPTPENAQKIALDFVNISLKSTKATSMIDEIKDKIDTWVEQYETNGRRTLKSSKLLRRACKNWIEQAVFKKPEELPQDWNKLQFGFFLILSAIKTEVEKITDAQQRATLDQAIKSLEILRDSFILPKGNEVPVLFDSDN